MQQHSQIHSVCLKAIILHINARTNPFIIKFHMFHVSYTMYKIRPHSFNILNIPQQARQYTK